MLTPEQLEIRAEVASFADYTGLKRQFIDTVMMKIVGIGAKKSSLQTFILQGETGLRGKSVDDYLSILQQTDPDLFEARRGPPPSLSRDPQTGRKRGAEERRKLAARLLEKENAKVLGTDDTDILNKHREKYDVLDNAIKH